MECWFKSSMRRAAVSKRFVSDLNFKVILVII